MTGKNPARHGVTQWLPGSNKWPGHKLSEQKVLCPKPKSDKIKETEITLGETLQKAGYETAFYGKWHMGKLKDTKGPKNHGFDKQMAVIQENSCSMFYPFRNHKDYFPEAKEGDNFTDKLTDNAIKFIDQKRDKPFFLYLAHFAMHAPIESKKELIAKFIQKAKDMNIDTAGTYKEDKYSHTTHNTIQSSPTYAGELSTLDSNIGRLIKHLKKKGLFEKTIIIITGDNGGRTSQVNKSDPTAVYPLRGGKTFTFNGGLRTPLLIHCPGIKTAGMQSNERVTSMDFYPTLLDMLGLPLLPEQHKDGLSLTPIIKGNKLSQRNLYWHFPHYQKEGAFPTSAIQKGNYKLIINYHFGNILLFDTSKDEGESKDLSKQMPELAETLKAELLNYLKNSGALIPQNNSDYDASAK